MSGPFAFRGPDGEIDLEEALGPHLRHYVAVMVSGANGTRMQALALGRTDTPHGALLRQGFGRPTRASSCADVAVQPGWSWDVCAYYLLLGVRWTATKREVRVAYKAVWQRSGGVQEERLTYAVSQLTDDRVRRAYDMVALGGVFLRDRDTAERLKKAAVAEAVRRMTEEGEASSADEVLEEMGLRKEQPHPEGEDPPQEEAPPAAQEAPGDRWGARWGHYVLSGPQGAPRADAALLEAWQGLVAAALRERGISTGFAVGVGAGESPKVLRDINEPCIFIMTEKGASPDKARDAVEMGISLGYVGNNSAGGI